ncbi:hypothetical protein OHA72_30955 [Dactylosporangium sp. NBC_01737]|uniref:hypothetical protein n=1 Tax=Dactylosporangium sp. NBC_01737 TaxID=2975959 RepID=UPI002E10E621|nr:hypothetical protein OHA72_30955 [Dactylosporangium sp. NBC_01737]
MLGEPRPGVQRPGTVLAGAEPGGRVAGQSRRADQGDAGRHVRPQVGAEQRLVERLPGLLGAGVRVRVDQPRHQPARGDRLAPGDPLGAPAVTVGPQLHRLAVGQRVSANVQDRHDAAATPSGMPASVGAADRIPLPLTPLRRCPRGVGGGHGIADGGDPVRRGIVTRPAAWCRPAV